MDGVASEENYDQYGNPMREDDVDDEAYMKRRINTTLPKQDGNPWLRKSHKEGLNYSATNKKGKKLNVKRRRRSWSETYIYIYVSILCTHLSNRYRSTDMLPPHAWFWWYSRIGGEGDAIVGGKTKKQKQKGESSIKEKEK